MTVQYSICSRANRFVQIDTRSRSRSSIRVLKLEFFASIYLKLLIHKVHKLLTKWNFVFSFLKQVMIHMYQYIRNFMFTLTKSTKLCLTHLFRLTWNLLWQSFAILIELGLITNAWIMYITLKEYNLITKRILLNAKSKFQTI